MMAPGDGRGKVSSMQVVKFQGYVTARNGFLLGGVKEHRSTWFKSYRDAINWGNVVLKTNLEMGLEAMGPFVESKKFVKKD